MPSALNALMLGVLVKGHYKVITKRLMMAGDVILEEEVLAVAEANGNLR